MGYLSPQWRRRIRTRRNVEAYALAKSEFVLDIRSAQNLLVIKTIPGSAQPVAVAIDAEAWDEVVGTVAGDDTLLIVSTSNKTARQLQIRLEAMRT